LNALCLSQVAAMSRANSAVNTGAPVACALQHALPVEPLVGLLARPCALLPAVQLELQPVVQHEVQPA